MSSGDNPDDNPDDQGLVPPSRFLSPKLGLKVFAAPANTPRARRATDLIMLGITAAGVALLAWISSPPAGFLHAVDTLILSFPTFLLGFWELSFDVLALYSIGLVVLTAVRRRWALLLDIALVVVLAFVLALTVGRIAEGSWPDAWEAMTASTPPAWFPSSRIAVTGAILLVANPYLSLPWRRLSRRLLGLGAFSAIALGATNTAGAVTGVLLASMAGALVHVVLGSSAGRPSLDQVRAALGELGVHPTDLSAATRQTSGFFTVEGRDEHGPLLVKVYGRDAYDTQLLASLWRTVWYRSDNSGFAFSRLQNVQHEALLTLLASQAGVATDHVVTAASTSNGDAFVVLRPRGETLADLTLSGDPLGDVAVLAAEMWAEVERMHDAGISHGQLDARHVSLNHDTIGIVGFGSAVVASEPQGLRKDDAQLLVTSVLAFGEQPAIQAAVDALGPERLSEVLPFLQPPALTSDQRGLVRTADLDLDGLRERTADFAGLESPKLQQLRRVTWRSLISSGLMLLAFSVLMRAASKLDVDLLIESLQNADWWLVAAGFVVAQTPRFAQSLATLGACPLPLPLGPVYALQLAISYVNLAVPTTAARIAVNVRFFQLQGLPPGTALSVGALDGFSGFIVQMVLLASMLLFGSASLDVELDLSTAGTAGSILLLMAVIAIVAVVVVALRATWRRAVIDAVTQFSRDAMTTLRGLHSPRRIGLLFGGNLASEFLFVLALALFVRALGYPIGLGELLFINLCVSLLSGIIPVPGGIGVTEGGLIFGLVSAGMPEEAAVGAVILYRVSTFYTPPIWGFFAFRWLERNRYL